MSQASSTDTPFVIAGRTYGSRLLVGTGKYKDLDETRRAIEAPERRSSRWRCGAPTSGRIPTSRTCWM